MTFENLVEMADKAKTSHYHFSDLIRYHYDATENPMVRGSEMADELLETILIRAKGEKDELTYQDIEREVANFLQDYYKLNFKSKWLMVTFP